MTNAEHLEMIAYCINRTRSFEKLYALGNELLDIKPELKDQIQDMIEKQANWLNLLAKKAELS